MTFVLARARLESGSIWPPILMHGAYNTVIQSGYWPAAAGMSPAAAIWLDMEAGILVAVVLILGALVLCRGRWTFRRAPDQPMAGPPAL